MPRTIAKKIVLLGDAKVGKTSLAARFVKNAFSETYAETIGVNISKKNIRFNNDGMETDLLLYVWDVMGGTTHGEVRRMALENVDGGLIVGDLTNPSSMKNVFEFWIPGFIESSGEKELSIVLNKLDLVNWDPARTVSEYERVVNLIRRDWGDMSRDWQVVLTSAKSGENVERAFHDLSGRILRSALGNKVGEKIPAAGAQRISSPMKERFLVVSSDVESLIGKRSGPVMEESLKASSLDLQNPVTEEFLEFLDILAGNLRSMGIEPDRVEKYVKKWSDIAN